MENKTHKTSPSPCTTWIPHLIQQLLGPPHAPPQTAARTVEALSHTDAVKSPLDRLQWRAQMRPRKYSFPWTDPQTPYLRHPWTRPTYDAKRHPDPIRRFSTMHWTDRPTDRPTDRSRKSLTTIGRCAPRATRPNKNLDHAFSKMHTKRSMHDSIFCCQVLPCLILKIFLFSCLKML